MNMFFRIICFLVALLVALPAYAANRYWVGGTGTWNNTLTTHWSTSSGGSSGASPPGSSDAAIFDSNSGPGGTQVTINQTGGVSVASINTSGFVGGVGGAGSTGAITVSGNADLSGAQSFGSSTITLTGTGSQTLTGGGNWGGNIIQNGAGGTYAIQENFASGFGNKYTLTAGTFSANNFNIAGITEFISTGNATRAITMGSGTWTFTGTGTVWNVSGTGITINGNTSTIILTGQSGDATFTGGGNTYNNITFSLTAGSNFTLTGANTFATMAKSGAAKAITLKFPANVTTTVTTFSISGTSGNVISLVSSSPGNQATLSQASGTVNSNYLNITDSAATGGATWNAGAASTDGGNNTGWIFANLAAPIFFNLAFP